MTKKVAFWTIVMMGSMAWVLYSDNLVPPGPPGDPLAQMKTLNELEPRNIISDLPYTITNSGSYYLGSSLKGFADSNGITVVASDVQIDLSGFSLDGRTNESWHGIMVPGPASNIKIRNGVIRGWGRHGINASNASSVVVSEVNVFSCGWGGIYANKNALIERCTIAGGGMFAPGGIDPPLDDAIQAGEFSTIKDCKIQNNGGAGIHTKSHTRISGCTITENRNAEGIFADDYCVIQDCVCAQNGNHGIRVQSNCKVIGNTCGENDYHGIQAQSNCRIIDNTCGGNGTNKSDGAGINLQGNNNVVEGNTTIGSKVGIQSPPTTRANLVIRNTASGNVYTNFGLDGTNSVGIIVSPTGGVITTSNPWANFGL